MIHVRTLGPPTVSLDGGPAPSALTWRKNLALLVYLARSPGRARAREHLVALLWGDKPEAAARHSLNEALRVLRSHLGRDAVVSDAGTIRLADDVVALDVDALSRRMATEDAGGAAELVEGEFLEGFGVPGASDFEDWLSAERELWRRNSVECLVARCEELLDRGDAHAGLESAERALGFAPTSNLAARALIRGLALRGDRAAALDRFETFVGRLKDDLEIEPEPETQTLVDRVRRQRLWRLPEPAAEGRTPTRSLPLVARVEELAALMSSFEACRRLPRATIAIVEGDAGTGKTRLAEEVVARARLDGAAPAGLRAVPADREDEWSGIGALASSGLARLPGLLSAPAPALAGLAALSPAWTETFAEQISDSTAVPPTRALSEVLRAAAEEQPVLIQIDDAQWLDSSSLRALLAVLRDVPDAPIFLLLCVARLPRCPELDEVRSGIGRDVPGTVVVLGPLGRPEVRELAERFLPSYGPTDLERLTRRVHADSGGVPLLATEILRAVAHGLELGETTPWPEPARTLDATLPGDLPDSVTAAIRIGFRRFTPAARDALVCTAVLGERVSIGRLSRTSGLPENELLDALDEAEWHRWLVSEPRGYSYAARIVGEVVARDMATQGQRRRIREADVGA